MKKVTIIWDKDMSMTQTAKLEERVNLGNAMREWNSDEALQRVGEGKKVEIGDGRWNIA